MEKKLETMQKILIKSTRFLSENLRPDVVLLHLKSEEAISTDEVKEIRAKVTDSARVELLLDILHRKPLASYITFMEVLKTARSDLHEQVKEVEKQYKFNSGNY